jgi:hypothetical protein
MLNKISFHAIFYMKNFYLVSTFIFFFIGMGSSLKLFNFSSTQLTKAYILTMGKSLNSRFFIKYIPLIYACVCLCNTHLDNSRRV